MDPHLEEAFRRARRGDPRAFRTLTDHLAPDLVRFLTFFLHGDAHAANDAAQETLVRAWDSLDAITDVAHLRRWCYRVGRCKAVSWLRRRGPPGRDVYSLSTQNDEGIRYLEIPAKPDPRPQPDDLTTALHRAMDQLPDRYAGPVHLYYVQGLDTRETARLLGRRRDTVKMQLCRARRLLKRAIKQGARRRDLPPEPAPEEST